MLNPGIGIFWHWQPPNLHISDTSLSLGFYSVEDLVILCTAPQHPVNWPKCDSTYTRCDKQCQTSIKYYIVYI